VSEAKLISERSHEVEQTRAIASNSVHESQNAISEASGRDNDPKLFSVASNKGYLSQDTSLVTGEILEETLATSSLSLAVSKTSVASLIEKAAESFDNGLVSEASVASNKDQLEEVPIASNKGQQVEILMASNKGQQVEVPMVSNKGQLVEVPVASPRIKKRARKEQLLQQHKLFGKTVLDRISKAADLTFSTAQK